MSDQDRIAGFDLLQELLQGICQSGNGDVDKRRRSAIAWHIPGNRPKTVAEARKLAAPRTCRATDTMQEYQWHRVRIACGFIGEASVLHRCRLRHAASSRWAG